MESSMEPVRMDVTPAQARAWLSMPVPYQLPVTAALVDKLADDMASGNWKLTHQAIAIDALGRVLDGQHRLRAIVKSGTTVPMWVYLNCPMDSFKFVDIGRTRKAYQVHYTMGLGKTKDSTAVARLIEYGHLPENSAKDRLSPLRLAELIGRHAEAIQWVFGLLPKGIRLSAPVVASICLAWYSEVDRQRLAEFVSILADGMPRAGEADKAAIRFRDMIMRTGQNYRSPRNRRDLFLITQRAIKAHMERHAIQKLYVPSEPLYFPPSLG